jgi:hypothetical protein
MLVFVMLMTSFLGFFLSAAVPSSTIFWGPLNSLTAMDGHDRPLFYELL